MVERKPGKMIRQKKEFVCTNCGAKSLKFAGYCPSCNKAGTMKEHILIPTKVKPKESPSQKTVRRRWKTRERDAVRSMTAIDGHDPVYRNVASSTGKVGHITGMQIDGISRNYVIEVKNRTLPIWINKAWIQIQQRAVDFGKHALLHMEPSNIAREFPVGGLKRKTENMAIVTQSRHESLIVSERALEDIRIIVESGATNAVKMRQIKDILGS